VSGGEGILALRCAEEDKLVSDIQVFDEVDSQVSGQEGSPVSGQGKQDCDQVSAVGTQVTVLENEVSGMKVSDQVEDTQVSGQGRQGCGQVSAVDTQVSLL